MKRKLRWITQTAMMLALLVVLQAVTKPLGQYVTGSCVNGVLAITALVAGLGSGITVALISPVCAFLFGIAPNLITVIPIMLGNVTYVVLLHLICGRKAKLLWLQPVGLLAAAAAKFAVLYVLVVQVICGVAANVFLGQKVGQTVILAPKMLEMLPVTFSYPQLITALIGGAVALLIVPVLRKALRK